MLKIQNPAVKYLREGISFWQRNNDLNAEIAEAILERAGLKTERVEDGIQCVNRIMQMPVGTYDVILMDIQMPKMDGYKATQEIRNYQIRTRRVYQSLQ